MRISVDRLEPGMVIEQDIFTDDNSIPFITIGTILTPSMISRLVGAGIDFVSIIGTEDAPVSLPPPRPSVDPKLRHDGLSNLEDLFLLAQHGNAIPLSASTVLREMDTVVERLVDSLLEESAALVNIADLKSYDEYTYHHSFSVAVLALAIGDAMGLNRANLNQLGRSAMMHDIGKTAIPIEVINKPSRLTDEEFALVKSHSPEGYNYLTDNHIGDDTMWQTVLFHHEKIDGTGYPYNLIGNQIPLMSRIISVADVYDALTSQRPYRNPMQPSEAAEYIMGNVDTAFDYDIVSVFMKKLELYPVGSVLELSNRKLAVVIDNEYTLRPVVKLLDSGIILDLARDSSLLSLTIDRLLPQIPDLDEELTNTAATG